MRRVLLILAVSLLLPVFSFGAHTPQEVAPAPAGAVASPNLGDHGCPDLVVCTFGDGGCIPIITNAGAEQPINCSEDGVDHFASKCGYRQCGQGSCPCGVQKTLGNLCKNPCN